MLDKAMLAAYRKSFKEANRKKSDLMRFLLACSDLYTERFYECDFLSRLLLAELNETESKEKELHDCYNRLRNYSRSISSIINRIWLKRIRFASRAIGNEWDYSLEMVATPPTTGPADEYVMNYLYDIRQQGGVRVGSLA